MGLLREEKNSAFRAQPLTSPAPLGLAPGLSWRWKIYFHGGSSDVPVGAGNDGKRVFVNHFWQLKDVAGEFWMNDAAIMQQTQLAEFLWLVTLQSRKRGSHRLGSD